MTEFIKAKVDVLYDFGLTDSQAICDYFTKAIADLAEKDVKERRVDTLSRHILTDFYNGSRAFIRPVPYAETCIRSVRERHTGKVTEKSAIKLCGKRGLEAMLESNLLVDMGTINGRKYYKIQEV